jgi:hypothetical protein
MDAEKAAARIVQGLFAGHPVVTLTAMAHLGKRLAGVAPATTTRLMGLLRRALPEGTDAEVREGMKARTELGPVARRVVDVWTTMGDRAARRTNETKPSPFVATNDVHKMTDSPLGRRGGDAQ